MARCPSCLLISFYDFLSLSKPRDMLGHFPLFQTKPRSDVCLSKHWCLWLLCSEGFQEGLMGNSIATPPPPPPKPGICVVNAFVISCLRSWVSSRWFALICIITVKACGKVFLEKQPKTLGTLNPPTPFPSPFLFLLSHVIRVLRCGWSRNLHLHHLINESRPLWELSVILS